MHAHEHHARTVGARGFNHGREIILHRCERQAAQAVVGAEFNDH